MSAGRDLLHELWRAGVTVSLADDRFRLNPAGVAPEGLRTLLRTYRPDVVEIITALPAAGRCSICGDPNGIAWSSGSHCVTCALISADALRAEGVIPPRDISQTAQEGAA